VQVALGMRWQDDVSLPDPRAVFAVLVVHHGRYPITGLGVRFVVGDQPAIQGMVLVPEPGFKGLPPRLYEHYQSLPNGPAAESGEVLARWDSGVRFETEPLAITGVQVNPHVIVRWIDRWGQEWCNRAGNTEMVPHDADWLD
jgi:hypothetical protein